MKVLIKKQDLTEALERTKSTVFENENVLFEATNNKLILTKTSSDLDLSVKYKIDAEVIEEGSFTLKVITKLIDTIKKFPENDIMIEKNNEIVFIKSGNLSLYFIELLKKDCPVFPKINIDFLFSFNLSLLKKMFKKVAFASAEINIKNINIKKTLEGIYWKIDSDKCECEMVASNNHILAYINKPLVTINIPQIEVIIPKQTVFLIEKIFTGDKGVQLAINHDKIVIFDNEKTLISNLIKEKYPNYKKVIPEKQNNVFTVNTKDLLAACRRVPLNTVKNNIIKFHITKERLETSIITSNFEVKENIKIKYNGQDQDTKIYFNYKYLIDILKRIDTEDINISFQNATSVVEIKRGESFYLIMPIEIIKNLK